MARRYFLILFGLTLLLARVYSGENGVSVRVVGLGSLEGTLPFGP